MSTILNILYTLYKIQNSRLRKYILRLVKKVDGGEFYSVTLRRIYAKYHEVEVGLYSYGCFDITRINAFTKIGRYCSFAEGVCAFSGNHPLDFISTHPFFYNPSLGYVKDEKIKRSYLEIGNDVWVGRNAIITPSVSRIGNGAVIGAGAVVTKDVPDYAVVVGNPAQIIKYRFSEQKIKKLLDTKWWNKSIEELEQNLEDFISSEQDEIRAG